MQYDFRSIPEEPAADLYQSAHSIEQDDLTARQEGLTDNVTAEQTKSQPHYPNWPTSLPGPEVTPPPPGEKPVNWIRREQMAEVGYDQATGEPEIDDPARSLPDQSQKGRTSFDQLETAQEKRVDRH